MNTQVKVYSLIGAVLLAAGWQMQPERYVFAPDSKVRVEGTSTVRDWGCDAKQVDGVVTAERAILPLDQIEGAVETVEIVIPVAQLDCRNGTMNDHMRKALKAQDNPELRYRLTTYRVETAEGTVNVALEGELLMAGATRPVQFPATLTRTEDGNVRVQGSAQLKMTEWGMKPPSLMLGTMKVGATVTVKFDVVLRGDSVEG
jgi:polyisoprenoid-binding protein YceI